MEVECTVTLVAQAEVRKEAYFCSDSSTRKRSVSCSPQAAGKRILNGYMMG